MNCHDYDTGNAAINYTFAPAKHKYITEVRLHLSAVGGAVENLLIVHNSVLGAAFDVSLVTQDMRMVQDLIWKPDNGQHQLAVGDSLDITYSNSNNRTYGLEVIFR